MYKNFMKRRITTDVPKTTVLLCIRGRRRKNGWIDNRIPRHTRRKRRVTTMFSLYLLTDDGNLLAYGHSLPRTLYT